MTPNIHISETCTNPLFLQIYFSFQEKNLFKTLPEEIKKKALQKAKQEEFTGKKSELLHIEIVTETKITHVIVLGLGENKGDLNRVVRDQTIAAICKARKLKSSAVCIHTYPVDNCVQSIAEGVILGDYSMDSFKNPEYIKNHPHIANVTLVTQKKEATEKIIERGVQAAQATILARDLVNMPGSHIYPETLAGYAKEIAEKSKGTVDVMVLSDEECKKLGMGSYLSVGKGSNRTSSFIILHYKGTGTKKFAYVGKSITFDSGGLSLKPGASMMDMKIDMAGGAAVLGVFKYLAVQRPKISLFSDVYGILPAAENMISGSATRPGDVVTALNGKTIEILNTDAEGRLVLADALVYAETVLKADYIIDIATLTGACMVALGADLAGVFTDDDSLEKKFGIVAKKAGDEYWKMPLHKPYLEDMKSKIADLKNIGGGRYGGAITAALFLSEFVKKAKWMHIDIAGPAHSDKNGASGWGVLSIIYFLEQITHL